MTDLLYLTDSYLREFDAKVVGVADGAVELDRTAFYPRGGGQQSDEGTLGVGDRTLMVREVLKEGGRVLHKVEGEVPSVGTAVHGAIAWDRRYALMRYHSALHVMVGVIFNQFGVLVTGGQMYTDRARMDFALEDLNKERVAQIENETNRYIAADLPIYIRTLPREEAFRIPELIRTQVNLLPAGIDEVRVVDIEGLDMQADGGTHVRSTKEIGRLRVTKTENKGKINKRLEIVLDAAD
ncbi:MAG: alanyl-tRNA editing protein [Chloroflexota bacterium]